MLVASPLAAQVLRGTVVDSASGDPITGVHVTVLNAMSARVGDTVTSANGDFIFDLPIVGEYRLQARRVGYGARVTEPITITATLDSYVRLRLAARPVTLDTLTAVPEKVVAENEVPFLAQAGFYDRMRGGIGHFLTRADIERLHPEVMTDLLHGFAGVTVLCSNPAGQHCDVETPGAGTMFIHGGTHGCHLTLVLDGVVIRAGGDGSQDPFPNEVLNPFNLEAVEVYTSSAGLPVQYRGYLSPCGAILAWSRR